jgi:hypothetical protein
VRTPPPHQNREHEAANDGNIMVLNADSSNLISNEEVVVVNNSPDYQET